LSKDDVRAESRLIIRIVRTSALARKMKNNTLGKAKADIKENANEQYLLTKA
jgi:hypothetical protein